MIRNYRDLVAWQKATDLVVAIYRVTKTFPKEEVYGLTAQLRRCAVSIPSNIAEGQGRGSDKEFGRFLQIAYGSLRELETQLIIAQRLEYLDRVEVERLLADAAEIGRLINGLMNTLRAE